jgi:hypothetical protein
LGIGVKLTWKTTFKKLFCKITRTRFGDEFRIVYLEGERHIIHNGFERLGVDVLFIVAAGLIVFWLKQVLVHRRKPLI